MADTRGFEVVIAASAEIVRKALRGAWKSAECPVAPGDEGRIPEFLDVPVPANIGGYIIDDGQVQIPQNELYAALAPDVGGVELVFGLHVQLEIQNPPVPSAQLLAFPIRVGARTPVGTLPDSQDVGVLLAYRPRGNVTATLTAGHPLAPILDMLLSEFVHRAYENGGAVPPVKPFLPHLISEQNVGFSVVRMDIHAELFDDLANPAYRIETSRPNPTTVRISIPMYLRMFSISAPLITLADPMGIETRLVISAPFETLPGLYRARLGEATVTVDPIQPASATVAGSLVEGANYTANKATLGFLINLDTLIAAELTNRGTAIAHAMGNLEIPVPTEAEIETTIGDLFHAELVRRRFIALWTPSATDDEFHVSDVTVRVIPDALLIALNAGAGSDIGAITGFIPPGREFAIALSAVAVDRQIAKALHDNGFDSLPKRFREDDRDVDLNSLTVRLVDGAIRMEGEVTVIDAILGSIDVDADFTVNVGLHWDPNAMLDSSGFQHLKHHIIGDPDVDPEQSVLFWVIAIILAVISFGAGSVLIAIIIIVVALVVTAIAESIGSSMLVNGVTGAIEGIQAWPSDLARIGRVVAVFHNNPSPDPDGILIEDTGLVLEGTMNVVSSCEATQVLAAFSGTGYSIPAASPVLLQAGHVSAAASYDWLPGDGSGVVATRDKLHVYADSRLYLAKHGLRINQSGGAASRHFALVDVRNVPPVVDSSPDIEVDEGEVVTLIGHFSDVEPGDTHESVWIFGDHQAPKAGVIVEAPDGKGVSGTSTVQHAWCDNGDYVVVLRVRDQNGGIGTSTRRVRVRNVAPMVEAGADMFAYPCTVITLTGRFTDPGWCDTHRATWEFGDCTPLHPAIVTETNTPPAARGTAVASHIYHDCGVFHATCSVSDDDSATGSDFTVIRVVDIVNAGFENGFRPFPAGDVGNGWAPFGAQASALAASVPMGAVFTCEDCDVHGGQRAQRIALHGAGRGGIHQSVGANPDWAYQVTVWAHVEGDIRARLGVNPDGGPDPDSAAVQWTEFGPGADWGQLIVQVTATGRAITVFLEARSEKAAGVVRFDDAVLIAIQPFCPLETPKDPPQETCLDLKVFGDRDQLPPQIEAGGYILSSLDGSPLTLTGLPGPGGGRALWLGAGGIFVDLPWPAIRVTLEVFASEGSPIYAVGVDQGGTALDHAVTAGAAPFQTLTLAGPGISRVQIGSKGREAALIRICATPARADLGDVLPRPARIAPRLMKGWS